MRATRVLELMAGVLTIGLIVAGFMAAHSRKQIEAQLAEQTHRRTMLQVELRRLQRAPAGSETKVAPAVDSASEPSTVGVKAELPIPPRIRPPGLMDFARDNPQLWNEFIQSKRVELGRMYLPLLQRLHVSPEQADRFKDIFAGSIARRSDIGAAADAQGLDYSDPAITALREQSERQLQLELAGLLGPSGFKQFEDYRRALHVRGFVDGLATQVAASTPLSAQQADRLERALAETNEAYRNGKDAEASSVDWESVDQQAQGILSPEQFAAWQLGVVHNIFGGSRRAQELTAVYKGVVKRMKETEGVGILDHARAR